MAIAAVVLSGGQSSRMGEDKATLAIGSQTLLARQYQLLKQFTSDVWVSGNYPGYPSIVDNSPAQGPLAGIGSSLRALSAQAEAVLFIAVDMPRLSSAVIAQVLANYADKAHSYYMAQSRFPMIIPTASVQLAITNKAENSGRYALQPYLNELQAIELPAVNPSLLINTNTPEQWQQAIRGIQEIYQ